MDSSALYVRLSAPQHAGLMTRLRHATEKAELRADADLDAIATALIGTLLLEVLTGTATSVAHATRYDGLLEAIFTGVSRNAR